jgi:hypothetical protein
MANTASELLQTAHVPVAVCKLVANCSEYSDLLKLVADGNELALKLDNMQISLGE